MHRRSAVAFQGFSRTYAFTICAVAVPRWDKKHQIHDLGDLSTLGPARTAAALGLASPVEAHLLAPVAQVRRHGK